MTILSDNPCPCCGQARPADWDDLISAFDDHGIEARFIDTGGACYAVVVESKTDDAYLLMTSGPLLPDRQAELIEAGRELDDETAGPGSYPTWELGFYGDSGEQEAIVNMSTTIHPDHDQQTALEIAGLISVFDGFSIRRDC